jgi:two-component system response regulator RstA
VLLVEDSARLAASIRDYLERHPFEVFIESDGLAVAERFERLKPDLVILDLMLPGRDGLTLCRELRRNHRVPILILTAKGENIDQVLGLEMGADDYVVKPVEPRVLLARVEALLRRARAAPPQPREDKLAAGRVEIDAARRGASLDRSIDARICRLRRKLQEAGGSEAMIKTVRLRGYLFTGDA